MKRLIVSGSVVLFMFVCSITITSAENNSVKVAFIRHHNLWIKVDGKEKQLTKGENITGPKWSHDGEWLAYVKGEKQNILELYRLKDGKKVTPFHSEASNYQWSPTENIIAFIFTGTLNTFDVEKRMQILKMYRLVWVIMHGILMERTFLYPLKRTYFQQDGQGLSYMKCKKMHI